MTSDVQATVFLYVVAPRKDEPSSAPALGPTPRIHIRANHGGCGGTAKSWLQRFTNYARRLWLGGPSYEASALFVLMLLTVLCCGMPPHKHGCLAVGPSCAFYLGSSLPAGPRGRHVLQLPVLLFLEVCAPSVSRSLRAVFAQVSVEHARAKPVGWN